MNKVISIFTKDSFIVPLVAVFLGLLTGAIVMITGGFNPIDAYWELLKKVFERVYDSGETIVAITPLIFTGLSVAFAFRTGLFNIGAEGQFIVGWLAAVYVGVTFDLPWYIHVPFAILAAALAGGLWGAIAGYLKATRGVHEVITTIMLNWIALYLSNYILIRTIVPEGQQTSEKIHPSAQITSDFLTYFFDNARMHWGTLLALIVAAVFYIILWKTKTGFELRAVGLNPYASEYAGMNVNGNVIKAMFIGGVIAGLGGACQGLGVFHNMTVTPAMYGYGFDGIAVALIGGNTPIGVIFGAILFGILNYGATGMDFNAEVPMELIRVVIASVIFFVAAHGIVRLILKPILNKNKKEVL